MQHRQRCGRHGIRHLLQGVAVLREDEDRLLRPGDETPEEVQLALVGGSLTSHGENACQPSPFFVRVVQAGRPEQRRRLLVVDCRTLERQFELGAR